MKDEKKKYEQPKLDSLGDKTGELADDQMREVTGGGDGAGDCWDGSSPPGRNCYSGSSAHAAGGSCGRGADEPGQCGDGSSAGSCVLGPGFEMVTN